MGLKLDINDEKVDKNNSVFSDLILENLIKFIGYVESEFDYENVDDYQYIDQDISDGFWVYNGDSMFELSFFNVIVILFFVRVSI